MKYLSYYKKANIKEADVFTKFIESLNSSIKSWDYFVGWNKVNSNVNEIKIELNLLNSLIGSDNLEKEFIGLVTKYPNIIKSLPVLLAVRDSKIDVIKDIKNDLTHINYEFKEKKSLTANEAKNYFLFIKESGLIDLFQNKKIKNFVDYVFGVEVGLDSNGRKNRGGTLMEDVTEIFIKKSVAKNNNLDYMRQATSSKIMAKWYVEVKYEKSERSFDFAVYNKKSKKLFLFETNYYNGGGSKLKAVCGEFKGLFTELHRQNIELVWVTDGQGWLTCKRPLEETFNNNNYVFNLSFLQESILDEIFQS